jgi:hypothetical protein
MQITGRAFSCHKGLCTNGALRQYIGMYVHALEVTPFCILGTAISETILFSFLGLDPETFQKKRTNCYIIRRILSPGANPTIFEFTATTPAL